MTGPDGVVYTDFKNSLVDINKFMQNLLDIINTNFIENTAN